MNNVPEYIALDHDSWLQYYPHWAVESDLDDLISQIQWQQHTIRLFGRNVLEPRLSAWIADEACCYRYSGNTREPQPWPEPILRWCQQLRLQSGYHFNSVLANLYRHGSDSMGWHSDDEAELGDKPMIASLSLGQPRRFLLRAKSGHQKIIELELGAGDLLMMGGECQSYYQHSVAKTKKIVGCRLNLTFRQIF
ncbi:alpha-ketoglutarate-dependent dioxygenase AlkB family protein [Celerinatantimonas sp. YJH-8]|uniref:alpha-ketoglutarate-dependent dioxygenase AlkB family protein n=1 Tax=Celerinatantimonas sp. YJH-8 TaxID=3228714 RepID=UPI0038C6CE64